MTLPHATRCVRTIVLFGLGSMTLACESDLTNPGRMTKPAFVLLTPGTVAQVSAGGSHTCAVRTDGTAACWGDNSSGQATPSAGAFTQVSAGLVHTCGIATDSTIACWGQNNSRQATPPAGTFIQVSAGGAVSCALERDASVACWGSIAVAETPQTPQTPKPPVATRLVFTVQPSNTLPFVAIQPPVKIMAVDSLGNTVTTFTGLVTVAIGKNGGVLIPGTLSGTKTVAAVNGYATFSDLSIDQPGTGYTLVVASPGLTGAESASFNALAPVSLP